MVPIMVEEWYTGTQPTRVEKSSLILKWMMGQGALVSNRIAQGKRQLSDAVFFSFFFEKAYDDITEGTLIKFLPVL